MRVLLGLCLLFATLNCSLRADSPAAPVPANVPNAATATPLAAPATALSAQDFEKQVAEIVAGPQVTIVRLWAPWCPNCRAEMQPEGWAKFIAANPDVKFVFIAVWHRDQDTIPRLRDGGLGGQPNLVLLTHPNPSRAKADRLGNLLGLEITWVPSVWVFKEGRLRYAFNYGETHFDILQQFVKDSTASWER